jgi:hypothetical protein
LEQGICALAGLVRRRRRRRLVFTTALGGASHDVVSMVCSLLRGEERVQGIRDSPYCVIGLKRPELGVALIR